MMLRRTAPLNQRSPAPPGRSSAWQAKDTLHSGEKKKHFSKKDLEIAQPRPLGELAISCSAVLISCQRSPHVPAALPLGALLPTETALGPKTSSTQTKQLRLLCLELSAF